MIEMSKGTSPNHRFSATYDGYYDPNFTAEISSKMQVPDRISATSDPRDLSAFRIREQDQGRFMMHVPDRIMLRGGDQHEGDDETLPELRLESSMIEKTLGVQLSAPPNMITLDHHTFPTIENDRPVKRKEINSNNHLPSEVSQHNDFSLSSPTGFPSDDDIVFLRRQVRTLSRRVTALEQDGQQRQQREIFLCSLGIVYFMFKGIVWLHRHW